MFMGKGYNVGRVLVCLVISLASTVQVAVFCIYLSWRQDGRTV
jgi:hypothetical protein